MSITIRPFDAALGAEICGVDLAKPLAGEDFAAIERAYYEYSLLLFRSQQISPAQQVDFSRRFGELEIHVLDQWRLDEHPEILIVSNIKDGDRHVGVYNAGRYWHTDLSYMQAPSRGSLLYALEVPHDGERPLGNTYFASSGAAYEALPEDLKAQARQATGQFSLAYQRQKLIAEGDSGAKLTQEQLAKTPVATHRLVQDHPVTGHPVLFINEGHCFAIEGMAERPGRELIDALCAHATRSEFVYGHQWQAGDLLMWDNLATQHLATFDYALPQRRYMHRTTLRGGDLP